MRNHLDEPANDRANHRSLIVALAGFSFAGLLALVALPGSLSERALPIWFVLISFLSYLATLNLQGYKAYRWHDQIGDALYEMAALGLIASVITFVLKSELPLAFRTIATTLAASVWLIDFIIRIRFTVEHLLAKEKAEWHHQMGRIMIKTRITIGTRIMIARSLKMKGSTRQSPSGFAIDMVFATLKGRVARSAESEGEKRAGLLFAR
jgi:hypothetical protein